MKKGFQRVKVDGTFYDIADVPALNKKLKHEIDVVVDRIVIKDGIESRLAESFETALELADGIAVAESADKKDDDGNAERTIFSAKFACPVSGFTIDEIEPRLFSFNNPFGACPTCDGLGTQMFFDEDLVLPDKDRTLREGAIAAWSKTQSPYYTQTLAALGEHYGFTVENTWRELTKKQQDKVLFTLVNGQVGISYI